MSAADNMALDAAMLSRYIEEDIPVLRLYRWLQPSFTYGVSQDPADEIDLTRCAKDGIGVAGRMTGGGVLFHNDDITYSFVCGKEDVGEPKAHLVSYREISAFLIRFYELLGLKAAFALEAADFKDKSSPHELCAGSHEKYDIVLSGKKIGGNAQKRKKQAIFQHGSIPCSIDWGLQERYLKSPVGAVKSTATSLFEELGCVPIKSVLEDKLIKAFGDTFGVEFIKGADSIYETRVVK